MSANCQEINQKVKKVRKDLKSLAMQIMEQISRGEDDVSKALAPIFAKAVLPTPEEQQRAKERRERGNPPGKKEDPLGDQLNWEQLLTRFAGKKRLWIISSDGDYGTLYAGRGFLNQFLHEELRRINPIAEAYWFKTLADGMTDFAEKTGVTADKLPSPEETKKIKKEEEQLPPFGWLDNNGMEAANAVIMRNQERQRNWYYQQSANQPSFVPLPLEQAIPMGWLDDSDQEASARINRRLAERRQDLSRTDEPPPVA